MAEDLEFGFDEKTEEGKDFNFIVVTKEDSIRNGINFKDFVVGKWDDGQPFLEVTVQDKTGKTASGRYSLAKDDGTDEDKKKKVTKIQAIVKNFATKVLGENAKLSGTSLQDFFEKAVAAIKAKPGWNKVDLTAMFIHDKNGYTKLRSFSPIVELTSNKEKVSKLQYAQFELDGFVEKKTPNKEEDIPFNTENTGTEETKLFE
jgi:hypothetical protein